MAINEILADSGYFDVERIRIFTEQGDMWEKRLGRRTTCQLTIARLRDSTQNFWRRAVVLPGSSSPFALANVLNVITAESPSFLLGFIF